MRAVNVEVVHRKMVVQKYGLVRSISLQACCTAPPPSPATVAATACRCNSALQTPTHLSLSLPAHSASRPLGPANGTVLVNRKANDLPRLSCRYCFIIFRECLGLHASVWLGCFGWRTMKSSGNWDRDHCRHRHRHCHHYHHQKTGRAPGLDGILNECFKNEKTICSNHFLQHIYEITLCPISVETGNYCTNHQEEEQQSLCTSELPWNQSFIDCQRVAHTCHLQMYLIQSRV